jgi:hypothetical protein
MVKTFAVIFGLVFLVVGILGFVPAAAPDGMLLNTFHVNMAHNMVHVASGIISFCSRFQIFGVIYDVIAIWGFAVDTGNTLWVVSNNLPTPGSTSCLPWSCFSWASARQGKPLPTFPVISLAVARLIRLATAAILLRDRAGFGVLHHSL